MRRFHIVAYQSNYGEEWVWVDRRTGNKWERIAIALKPREYYINGGKTTYIELPRYIWREILERRDRGY